MKLWFIIFVTSFIGYFLATLEIGYIARGKMLSAIVTTAISGIASFAIITAIVISTDRWQLMVPIVLGDVLATMAGMWYLNGTEVDKE